MKKFSVVIALCLALCSAFPLSACTKTPAPSVTPSVNESVDPVPVAEILSVTETQIAICINEVEANTTLISVMATLKEYGAFTYEISGGMVTSMNGKKATGNEFWGLYTSDPELSNTAWGTVEYEGKTLGSAVLGAESLVVVNGAIYVWQLSSF